MKKNTVSTSYSLEDLTPVFSRLAARYTGYESTSLSYEKAQQLMGAILYCIREYEQAHPNAIASGRKNQESRNTVAAEAAYRLGLRLVKEKVQCLMTLYHSLLPDFDACGLRCLEDTFYKGIPEFFKWYDPEYAPQDTILTLDYPVLADLSPLSGVDAVYEYVRCLSLEQTFLGKLNPDRIRAVLRDFSPEYPELIENVCDLLLYSVFSNQLVQKKASVFPVTASDLEHMLAPICGQDTTLKQYLALVLANLACRMNTKLL